jgi:hypothetical protein
MISGVILLTIQLGLSKVTVFIAPTAAGLDLVGRHVVAVQASPTMTMECHGMDDQ